MRNVVLLCLDTVRQDYFDRFASRLTEQADTVYTQCRAASGWSIPSHASMFTGELPHVHGVHTHSRQYSQIDRAETFIADLPTHTHIGVSTNAYASGAYGFDSYFDEFTDVSRDGLQFEDGLSPTDPSIDGPMDFLSRSLRHRHPLRSVANGVLWKFNPYDYLYSGRPWPERKDNGTTEALSVARSRILDSESTNTPVFAFLNLMEAHFPMYHHREYDQDLHSVSNNWTSKEGPDGGAYDISHNVEEYEQYLENYRELYRASIDYMDRHVSAWIEELCRNTNNDTTVVITSDHGHNLGTEADGFLFGHHTSLSEAVLHVPLLIINPPDGYPERQERLVSHLELGALLVALAHDDNYCFAADQILAEVIGHTGAFPISSKLTYWDRLIRTVFDGTEKTTWDSLGSVDTSTIDPESPSTQTHLNSMDGSYPAEDVRLFDVDIQTAKRTAVQSEIDSRDTEVESEVQQRLSDLGYV